MPPLAALPWLVCNALGSPRARVAGMARLLFPPAVRANGGMAALRYFSKFHPGLPEARARALLVRGWRLRLVWRRVLAALGHARSASVARRYRVAIEQVSDR